MPTVKRKPNDGHDAKGRFLPGNKGGGRPAVAQEFKDRCRAFMDSRGWKALSALATNRKHPDHIRALTLMAHYAYGKPPESLELTGAAGRPLELVVTYPDEKPPVK